MYFHTCSHDYSGCMNTKPFGAGTVVLQLCAQIESSNAQFMLTSYFTGRYVKH